MLHRQNTQSCTFTSASQAPQTKHRELYTDFSFSGSTDKTYRAVHGLQLLMLHRQNTQSCTFTSASQAPQTKHRAVHGLQSLRLHRQNTQSCTFTSASQAPQTKHRAVHGLQLLRLHRPTKHTQLILHLYISRAITFFIVSGNNKLKE